MKNKKYKGEYVENDFHILIKKCCISCKFGASCDETHALCMCSKSEPLKVGRFHSCPRFALKPIYESMGSNPIGQVKRQSYLKFYADNINSPKYAGAQDKTYAIRQDYEKTFGVSIYLNKK